MLNRWLENAIRSVCLLAALLALAACGGGGGDSGGPGSGGFLGENGESKEAWTLTLSLKDSAGNDLSALDAGQTATLQVLFLYDKDTTSGNNGEPVSGEVVNVSATLADVSPADGRVTNDDGIAEFTVIAGKFSGAAVITATAEGGSATVTSKLNVNIEGIEVGAISAELTDLAGNDISRVDPLTTGKFTVSIEDNNGDPISDLVVNAASDIGALNPTSGTALTGANGTATFIVTPGTESGAGTLTASVAAGSEVYDTQFNFEVDTELPYELAATFFNTDGEEVSSANTNETLTLQVLAKNRYDDDPIAYQIVSVSIDGLGSITPASGQALTNDEGKAKFTVQVGDDTGAFTLTMQATLAGGTVSREVALNVGQAERSLGYFEDGSFVAGSLLIQPAGQLSSQGTAVITLAVADAEGNRATSNESVTLTSECLYSGDATLDPPNPIRFNTQTSISYIANGCAGTDEITATLASTGAEASGSIEFAPLEAEAISFVAATPNLIALRDTGAISSLSETAQISFKVTNLDGNPIAGATVNFSLSSSVGGAALSCVGDDICDYASDEDEAEKRSTTATAQSNLDGIAKATLLSGFVASPVRVVAYVDLDNDDVRDTNEPQSASNELVITSGLPDQDSISLSASFLNVAGAWDTDGKTSELTVRMADKFNNPVPDGTQAAFITEYGSIVGRCATVDGLCTVTWTSQAPRLPAYVDPVTIYNDIRYDCASHNVGEPDSPGGPCPTPIAGAGYPLGGRSTILVYAVGEESFVDTNGNGRYDEGEYWTNLPEAFLDENEDGVHTPSQRTNCSNPNNTDSICKAGFDEFYVDFNENGVYDLNDEPEAAADSDLPDGLYNGVLCRRSDAETGVCSDQLVNVRDQLVVVMSPSDAGAYYAMVVKATRRPAREETSLDDTQNYRLYVSDVYNNPPPPGSEITFEGSGRCDVLTPAPTIGDTNAPVAFAMGLSVSTEDCQDPTADPDNVSIILKLPNGSQAVWTYGCIVDNPGTTACPSA